MMNVKTVVAMMSAGVFLIFLGCAKKQTVKAEEETTKPAAEAAPAKVEAAPQAAQAEDVEKLLQSIHFDFDKYNVRPGDGDILKENARVLKDRSSVKIKIEGNCDERGSVEYNLALGERRAKAAQNYLVTLGIEKKRISTISYGKEKPVDPGHDEEAWAKNRRDDFRVAP